jgi:glycosyltransferase involved in cell wall biosynthesis
MRCPRLDQLPAPPPGKTGWPWTEEARPLPDRMDGGRPWPRISIVTPSFNQCRFIEETIRSVLLQGYPDLEYIVIDGASADGSVAVIRKYESWLAYWASEPDRGQSDAINKGLQRATGEILAFINSDDTYCPGAFARAAEALADDPSIGLVYGNCYVIDETSARLRKRTVRQLSLADLLGWSPSIPQPSVFIRREALECAGWFNTDLHYVMDYDMWLRIGLRYKMKFVPHMLANMRGHGAAKTAVDPLQHVTEALGVAERFFEKKLPADIAGLRDRTLASLHIRKARVHAWQNEKGEARASIGRALKLCARPGIVRKALMAYLMSLAGPQVPRLRQLKRRWLQLWVSRTEPR